MCTTTVVLRLSGTLHNTMPHDTSQPSPRTRQFVSVHALGPKLHDRSYHSFQATNYQVATHVASKAGEEAKFPLLSVYPGEEFAILSPEDESLSHEFLAAAANWRPSIKDLCDEVHRELGLPPRDPQPPEEEDDTTIS